MSLRSKLLKLLKIEWQYTYRSARRDGWSRKYSSTLFLGQLLHGLAEMIEDGEDNELDLRDGYLVEWEEYRRERQSIRDRRK
jgi:hypothetical protein